MAPGGKGTKRPHYGERRPRVQANGYVKVYDPNHRLAGSDGYVYEHRKVVFDAGISVPPKHEVHHKNLDHADNRLENLQVVTIAEHRRLHGTVGNQWGTWEVAQADKECAECHERKPREAFWIKPNGQPFAYCRPCQVVRTKRFKASKQRSTC